jgi:PleD family two-component response regulator
MGHGCTFSIELPIIVNKINTPSTDLRISENDSYNTPSTDLRISENDSYNNDMTMNKSESPLSGNLSNGSTILDSESEHGNAKLKALVVDDSSMNRKMVRRLLEMKGNGC